MELKRRDIKHLTNFTYHNCVYNVQLYCVSEILLNLIKIVIIASSKKCFNSTMDNWPFQVECL